MSDSGPNPRRVIMLIVAVLLIGAVCFCSSSLLESVDAGDIMVVQAPMSGNLTWHTTPGIKWQGFGEVTTYKKRGQFAFYAKDDKDATGSDGAIKVRFNDGAHGAISGSLAYELPLDPTILTNLHGKYRTPEAIQQQLIRPIAEKSVYLTGPQMSSKQSISEKRNDLLFMFEDQMQNGVYRTETVQREEPDPITHQMKMVSVVQLARGKDGTLIRAEGESPLNEFKIKIFNLSLKEIQYDAEIEAQIKQQQAATMQVQLAIAKAKEAEQEAVTVAKQGEANAAKAKWEQEVVKTKAVTQAEQQYEVAVKEASQRREVAKLDTEAAEQFKLAETLKGEGEGARRRAAMEANGALEAKLAAVVEINRNYANAIEKHQGPLVPSVVMGNNGGASGSVDGSNGIAQLIQMLTAKAALDIGVDMSVRNIGTPATAGK